MSDFDNIEVEITNYENSDSRNQRLNQVYGYIHALADHFGNTELMSKIERLHDTKGILEVYYSFGLTEGEKEWVRAAWEGSVGCEPPENVEFFASKQ